MKISQSLKSVAFGSLLLCLLQAYAVTPGTHAPESTLAGTWTLVAADVLRPDGSRVGDYGATPGGLLQIDSAGHYSLQIYKTERPRFAAGDKLKGTPAEYEQAVLGASTHFGTLSADSATHTLTLNIERSSYPNQEGTTQKRIYELKGDELSYRVATRPDGSTPVSIWRRIS